MSNEDIEIIIKAVSPHLINLSDTTTRDRPAKRRAIEAVKKELSQIKTWTNSPTAASELLAQLVDSLLVCTESGIESVREHTVNLLDSLISICSQGGISAQVIEKILKSSVKRLKQEETEEIRVAWMELCVTLITKLTDSKTSITESELMMDLMEAAGQDPFSEVLHRVAKLIILFAQHQPKSTDYACDRMIRLCIPLLVHKHTAVRVLGIKAMEQVLIVSPKGLPLLYEEQEERQAIVPTLIYDSSPFVRDNLFTSLGKLLCNWSPRDRYQYGEKILPIILFGTLDELPSIQSTCQQCLNQVGQSCTRDLVEADIIHELPTDDKVSEAIGLKHLVHMCFDKSLIQLLDSCTDFITVKQATGLDSLRLFLSYANENDLVKQIKRLLQALLAIYINKREEPMIVEKLWDIVALLQDRLPSADIYLDVLISRLDNKYLVTETNGFPGSLTVLAVTTFLYHFISVAMTTTIAENDKAVFNRVLVALDKPYLNQYIVEYKDTIQQIEKIKSLFRHRITVD